MRSPNPEREKKLYELWELEYTIDEAASLTNVPRSTVGYYFKKFKKKDKKNELSRIIGSVFDESFNKRNNTLQYTSHKNSQIDKIIRTEDTSHNIKDKNRSQEEIITSTTVKFLTAKEIIDLMTKKDYTRLYYFLSCYKMLGEINQKIKLEPEELSSILKAFQQIQQQKNNAQES